MRFRRGVVAVTLVLTAALPVGSILAQQDPKPQPETTLQAAGKQYGAGWFHRFLMGSEYREVWTTPITVPVLDMDTFAGGVRAVSRTGHKDHVQIMRLNDPVQVAIYKGQRRAGAPVTEQTVLDVLGLQRLAQERVGLKVNHAECEVVAGRPKGVNFPRLFFVQRIPLNRRACNAVSTQVVGYRPCGFHALILFGVNCHGHCQKLQASQNVL